MLATLEQLHDAWDKSPEHFIATLVRPYIDDPSLRADAGATGCKLHTRDGRRCAFGHWLHLNGVPDHLLDLMDELELGGLGNIHADGFFTDVAKSPADFDEKERIVKALDPILSDEIYPCLGIAQDIHDSVWCKDRTHRYIPDCLDPTRTAHWSHEMISVPKLRRLLGLD